MRKKLTVALAATLIFFAAGFFWWFWATQPASNLKPASSKIFVIQKGESLTSVANRLEKKGLIRSSLAFKIVVLTKSLAGNIQAGDFRLKPSLTLEEIVYILTHGTLDIWLTFPEGWRREEFGRRLAANLEEFSYQEFLDLSVDLEGYLFPDTYLIPKEASLSGVIKIFERNFQKRFSSDLEATARARGLSKGQVIILASIVEREAKHDKDRTLIAGILLKRWHRGWPLQADATVQYAVSSVKCQVSSQECDWWSPVKKTDLQIDSPYNTYKYKSLPPTPICSPGLVSIKAIIDPKESDYWFYLSDSTGTVHYAKTNEEHNENIGKYLR